MTEENWQAQSEPDSSLMDSLLRQLLRPDVAHSEARIGKLIESIQQESSAQSVLPQTNLHAPRSMRRWFPISVASAVLLAILFVLLPGSSQKAALAAVERSILAERRNEAREYEVTLVTRGAMGWSRVAKHKLYVRNRDFVICATPRLGSGEVWIGGRGNSRWLVPRSGPVWVGEENLFEQPTLKSTIVETPFLSVAVILERMRRGYDLALDSGVSLVDGNATFVCDHIVGTRLLNVRIAIPQRVDLWVDKASGFARRIELKWGNESQETRWLEATSQMVGTPELPADFFDHAGHHAKDRIVENVMR